uniref:Uncharacterized protein n=1 Tax=viral metagenome TaxID=1070528 RepID=A0A6C0DM62_9ZZZZ
MSPYEKRETIQCIVYIIFIIIFMKLTLNAYRMLEYYESLDNLQLTK